LEEIGLLRKVLDGIDGKVLLEFTIPRMGQRIDAVVVTGGIILVIEFKIHGEDHHRADIDQVYDYAIDLKYFHSGSHQLVVVPVLVSTNGPEVPLVFDPHGTEEGLFQPVLANSSNLRTVIESILARFPCREMDLDSWEHSQYSPTPTIIEAARALYSGHEVAEISRSDAGATNLSATSNELCEIIERSMELRQKSICFVTGVPGAGKTLVGLNIATKYSDERSELHSVYLSGNGPLVAILREALARDTVKRESQKGNKIRKGDAVTRVKAFIQNVHHFRDECLRDNQNPPSDHVTIFDEAQRAWNHDQTAAFMLRKRGLSHFEMSEPEFLISCMDRREDWAVIICLVGGGQEINTGEAGISEWFRALESKYNDWHVYLSPDLLRPEHAAGEIVESMFKRDRSHTSKNLHLNVSLRSFRAEQVSHFVRALLDCEVTEASHYYNQFGEKYPICLTRSLRKAKDWLRLRASGSERFGMVVSSQAERLKPHAIDVRSPINPVKWFLDDKADVRSSYYLEDVATEFHVQGLELDWVCLSWDGDFRYSNGKWDHFSFRGSKWQRIKKESRKTYLKNAYRVLLTRARQGVVIFIPEGSDSDPTRQAAFYDPTFEYLCSLGLPIL